MNRSDFNAEKISDIFYVFRHTGGNIGVCIKDESALMIDTGYLPKKSASLITMLEENLGCRVELVFNTHYHSDHTFGNQSFSCPILSSAATRKAMRDCLSTHWNKNEISRAIEEDRTLEKEWEDLVITEPTIVFENDQERDFHGVRVVFRTVGGHTRDSSTAYFPDHKILFSGDIIFGGCYPTLLRHDGEPLELIEILKEVKQMDVETIVPGHGVICDKSTADILIDYWSGLLSEIRDMIVSGKDLEYMLKTLITLCHIPEIPFDERKHKRNVDSVVRYMLVHPAG